MLSNLSLKAKLVAAFLGIASLLLVVGGISWFSTKTIVASYDQIANQNLPNINLVGRMRYRAQEINRLTLRSTMEKNPEAIAKFKADFDESIKIYGDFVQKYNEVPFVAGEAELFEKTESTWKVYVEASKKVMALAGNPEKQEEIQQIIQNEVVKARVENDTALNDLLKFHEADASKSKDEAQAAKSRGESIMFAVIALGFLLAAVIGFVFATVLAKTLGRISEEISGAADQTSAAGAELSASSQQLSEGSSEAASSLEETVASLEELSSMVKTNANNAKEANSLSQASSQSAEKGETEIAKLINAMSEIASGSKKIEEIISVIDDIAFQTNLLALNAAVEAARAGEQGKGFAVVAEAVRNLAQKSAEAAKDINTLIKENVEKSVAGAHIASQSGVVLKDIVTSVKKVTDLNNEISSASQEQASGIEQISKAMNQLDQATQGNAASSEEVAASSEEMSSQANLLAQLVVDLRTLVQGKSTNAEKTVQRTQQSQAKKSPQQNKPQLKLVKSKANLEEILPLEDNGRGKVGNVSGF